MERGRCDDKIFVIVEIVSFRMSAIAPRNEKLQDFIISVFHESVDNFDSEY
jgi:hypothetical protein